MVETCCDQPGCHESGGECFNTLSVTSKARFLKFSWNFPDSGKWEIYENAYLSRNNADRVHRVVCEFTRWLLSVKKAEKELSKLI